MPTAKNMAMRANIVRDDIQSQIAFWKRERAKRSESEPGYRYAVLIIDTSIEKLEYAIGRLDFITK